MELDLLSSRINLNHTCLKLEVSLYDIRRAMYVYEVLEKEFRTARQMNFNLERLNLEKIQEIQNLKRQIELNNIDL